MLSYRHGFHAGNHADVLKHLVWTQLLHQLTQKDRPLCVVDTHAGAGVYSLESRHAVKNAEFETGIARLWPLANLPSALARYVEQVRGVNPDGVLRNYPGSPQIAMQSMRERDRLCLFEMHTSESKALQGHFCSAGSRISITAGDGFKGLKRVLPPASRRGLVLIDPSYENASDGDAVVLAVREALRRFATGTYVVWYPLLQRRRDLVELPARVLRIAERDWLFASLAVKAPSGDGFGMHGSGVLVVNPPWNLEIALGESLPALVQALGQDDRATFDLKFRQT